ncbi:MAG: hypothetical protein BWK75_06255 [Candidatus Altiarchaeales archaeon A3]|nr:MAG: hypothetical protein BWK75_06255 [Candidatus Altiarchaeales archaeon A3]
MKMTNRKIKLLFIHDNLELGGGERILLNILHNLDKNKFDFSLVLSEKKGVFLNDVKDIDIIDMKIKKIKYEKLIWRFFRYVERFYKVYDIINLKKPDIVITFSTTLAPIIAFTKLFVIREKVIIGLHIFKPFENCFLGSVLTKLSYLIVDKVIPVSNGIAEDLNKNFNVPKDKIKMIHNGINIDGINKLKNEKIYDDWFKKDSIKILSCGRLGEGKGHSHLIKAFKIVKESGINTSLIILGEGYERIKLENLAKNLNIR